MKLGMPPSPQAQAALLLSVMLLIAILARFMPPLPEWWSGFLMGAGMAYSLMNVRLIKCRQDRIFRDMEMAQKLEKWAAQMGNKDEAQP